MIHTPPPVWTIMPTLEKDSAGRPFRLVLRDGRSTGRVYQGRAACNVVFNEQRPPIVRETLGEIYAALMNGED